MVRNRIAPRMPALVVTCALMVSACAASSARPAQCTGVHVMRAANGQCVPCGDEGQACCPDEDPNTGPPFGDYCTAEGTDCLVADPAFGNRQCVTCGHAGQRACASGCVQGFPAPSDGGVQICSCTVPRGMDPLPNCPPAQP